MYGNRHRGNSEGERNMEARKENRKERKVVHKNGEKRIGKGSGREIKKGFV